METSSDIPLRDVIAIHAMSAMLSAPGIEKVGNLTETICKGAYIIADAMIEHRLKPPTPSEPRVAN